MSDSIPMVTGLGKIVVPDIDKVNGPGAKLAFVQLILAGRSRDEAIKRMDELEFEKKEAVDAPKMLEIFKQKLKEAQDTGLSVVIMGDEVTWCNERGIKIPYSPESGSPFVYRADDWQKVVENTQAYIDGLKDDTQSLMVLIQDALGQYNAYTQGASANVSNANSVMQGLARW